MADVIYDPNPQMIEHPGLRALYSYWDGRRGDGMLPGRKDLDPLDIPKLLPNLILVDVADNSAMRLRLIGTALVNRLGRDVTGWLIEEAYPNPNWEIILEDYRYVIGQRRPCLRWNAINDSEGRSMPYQRLLLPLAHDGQQVDMLLGAVFWHDPE